MSPTSRNYNAIANLRRKESLLYRIITRLNKMINQQKNLKVLFRMKNRYLNKVYHVQNCLALELKLFKMRTDKQNKLLEKFNNLKFQLYIENDIDFIFTLNDVIECFVLTDSTKKTFKYLVELESEIIHRSTVK